MQKTIDFDKIVCDNGSGFLKMGYAGDNFPRYTIPSIVGRPALRYDTNVDGVELKEIMFGDEANPLRSLLDIKYPIEEGQIRDWDDFEKLWEYTLHTKMGQPKDLKDKMIIVTEAAVQPPKNRERMAEIIFEKFGFGACMFETQALLSLMAEGHSTGLVMDSGDGVSHIIPVIEGQVQKHAVGYGRLNLAGRHVTKYLVKLLAMRGYSFNSTADFEVVREIKEQCCFVSYDRHKDRKLAEETTLLDKDFKLPDGKTIRIGRERFECAEALFRPKVAGVEDKGFHEKIFEVIEACDIDVRLGLMENIVLTGGTTMFPGLSTRLDRDLRQLYCDKKYGGNMKQTNKTGLMIHDPPRRKHNVFIGASFLANRCEVDQWITKDAYDTIGKQVVHQNQF